MAVGTIMRTEMVQRNALVESRAGGKAPVSSILPERDRRFAAP